MTGIAMIIFFAIDIFKNMKKEGKFDMSILMASTVMNAINAIASFGGLIVQSRLG